MHVGSGIKTIYCLINFSRSRRDGEKQVMALESVCMHVAILVVVGLFLERKKPSPITAFTISA
jgi:hypothetical protein